MEVELRDPDSGLCGRIDRIERDGSTTRVVDLKTGPHQEEPTEEQRRQLLLYAVLIHRTTGDWPTSIAIEDASGTRYTEPLDASSAEQALADVQSAVAAFNTAIDKDILIESAEPSDERCGRCAYRVVCHPYWDALESSWDHRSVVGTVVASGKSGGGAFAEIQIERPTDRTGRRMHLAGVAGTLPTDGKIAVIGWIGPADGCDVRARWSTVLRTW